MYLIMEKKPKMSFDYFLGLIDNGALGLCISRQHPESLKAKYSGLKAHTLWLTTALGENYINPTNIGILTNFTVNFMQSNRNNSAIILDGVEYLTLYNDFNNILKSIYFINEVAMMSGAVVIVPLAPQAFTEKNLALLEREAEIARPNK